MFAEAHEIAPSPLPPAGPPLGTQERLMSYPPDGEYTIGDLVERAYAYVDRYGTGVDRDANAARLMAKWLRRARVTSPPEH